MGEGGLGQVGGSSGGPLCYDCGEPIEEGDRLETVALGRNMQGTMTVGFAHVYDCENDEYYD